MGKPIKVYVEDVEWKYTYVVNNHIYKRNENQRKKFAGFNIVGKML